MATLRSQRNLRSRWCVCDRTETVLLNIFVKTIFFQDLFSLYWKNNIGLKTTELHIHCSKNVVDSVTLQLVGYSPTLLSVHGSVNLGNDLRKQWNCKQFEVLIVFYPVDSMESALSPIFLFVRETQSDYMWVEHSIVVVL